VDWRSGLCLSYFIPSMDWLSDEIKKQWMEMRELWAEYFEDTDRILQLSLKHLFPDLKEDLATFISIEELIADKIPTEEILKALEE
jgi:hypothetical protein